MRFSLDAIPKGKRYALFRENRSQFSRNCLPLQHVDAGQRLAFHPFQESAAGGRDIGEVVGDAGMVECGHRIAATGDRDQLAGRGAGRRVLCRCHRRMVERFDLKGADRSQSFDIPVPWLAFAARVNAIIRITVYDHNHSELKSRDA